MLDYRNFRTLNDELLASNNHWFNYRNFFHNDVNALSKKEKKKERKEKKKKKK